MTSNSPNGNAPDSARKAGEPIWSSETEYYERYSDTYFPILPFFHHGIIGNSHEEFLNYLLLRLKPTHGSRLVDLGCGSGYFVGKLTERGVLAVGISTSNACISGCRKRYPKARFELANMESFISPGATHVTAMESLGYADARKTLSCVARTLIPGGVFYVNDVFRKHIEEDAQQRANREYFEHYWKYKARRVDEFIALAYEAGLELREFRDLSKRANPQILRDICAQHDEVPYQDPYPERGSPTYPVEFIFTRRRNFQANP